MILTGKKIITEVKKDRIWIKPFNERYITTNSFDLHLGNKLIRYKNKIIDPKKPQPFKEIYIPADGYKMKKGDFLLGSTQEKIGSPRYVPMIHARSGIARMGLFVHVTADLIDIGSFGNSTLQLFATLPIILYSGMRIAQVSFWQTIGEIFLYKGKYQSSEGPRISEIYKDFA